MGGFGNRYVTNIFSQEGYYLLFVGEFGGLLQEMFLLCVFSQIGQI